MSAEEYPNAWAVQYNIGVHDGVGIAKDKLNEMKDIINEMFDSIQRVRELHSETRSGYCEYCSELGFASNPKESEYPCPTIKALDGEQ